jgi:MFS family permease
MSTFSAFRHRNYRLFFVGQLISVVGTMMQSVAQGWLVYELTDSRLLLGVISALGQLPSFFFSVFGGALVDRLPKRTVIIFTQATAMTLAFVLAGLVHWQVVQVWHVAAVALCSGFVMAVDIPARQSFVVDMVGKEDLLNAIALNSSCFNLARILGPSVAGLLIMVGMDWCFFLNGVSFIAVIIGLLMMRLPEWVHPEVSDKIVARVREGFAYVRGRRDILVTLGLMAAMAVFGFSYQVLMPVFARDILRVGPQGLGFLSSANGVGALTAALLIASRKRPTRRLQFGMALLFAAAVYGFSLSQSFHLSLALLVVAGGCSVAFIATCNTMLQLAVPDEMRGRVMGLYSLSFIGMGPAGSLLSGTLAHAFGAPWAVCIGAVAAAGAAIALALLLIARRGHRLRPAATA